MPNTFDVVLSPMILHPRGRLATAILVLLPAAIGCSKADDGRLTVYPVHGKVTSSGAPVAGAEVVFYGATPELTGPGTPAPAGTTDAHGEFELRSYEAGDGAPAGKFRVTIFWPEPVPPDADQEMYRPRDRFQGRYLDPKTSGLTADVPEGGGALPPFALCWWEASPTLSLQGARRPSASERPPTETIEKEHAMAGGTAMACEAAASGGIMAEIPAAA